MDKPESKPEVLNHWGVDVRVNHEHVLTIESNCVFGKSKFSELQESAIREAARNLLAFIGDNGDG